ncbi:hypothetical protein QJS10_CPB22g01165 [Acorus calamus]|uniref:Uncharacterized protein n=1 Tax=Acorus calamus TaxID=4465 RepID=A0AAV9C1N7_ACOCL|nr:hypothetical protein QJS10_CPB22g01165 [Acorus calamus]
MRVVVLSHVESLYCAQTHLSIPSGGPGLNEVHEQISKDEARWTRSYARKMKKADAKPQKPGEPRDSAVPAATTRARTPLLRNKHKGREFGDTTKLKNCSGKIEKEYNVMNEEEEEYEEPLIDKRRKQRPLTMDDTCPTHSCFRFRATNLARYQEVI